ncbi:MAG: hypothetical protein R2762_01140 [Bryobacteraceae bacterium]
MNKLSFGLGLALFAVSAFGAKFEGVISDAKCKHADASKAGCITKCIDGGTDAVLLSGDKVFTLKGDKEEFKKHAGHTVTINGKADGDSIEVKKITMK